MTSANKKFIDFLDYRIKSKVETAIISAYEKNLKDEKQEKLSLTEVTESSFLADTYLKSKARSIIGNIDVARLQDEANVTDNLIRMLSLEREEWNKYCDFFAEFELLSEYLMESNLNTSERFAIIMFFIEKNISTGILEKCPQLFDLRDNENISLEDRVFFNTSNANELFSDASSELSDDELKERNRLIGIIKDNSVDASDYQTMYRLINDHYLSKKETFTVDDLNIFIEVLKKLGVSEDLNKQFFGYLKSSIEKRHSKQEYKFTSFSTPQASRKYITDSEYRHYKKIILKYYDINKGNIVRPIDINEVYYCASLMAKIGLDDADISTLFLRFYQQECISADNTFAKYGYLYDKLEYYAEQLGQTETLKFINDCIKEMMISSADDYVFWKNSFISEANNVISQLPNNFGFEVSKAKSLINKY